MQNTRVLVASGYSQIRQLLSDMVRDEPGAAVAAEAASHVEAITLAKQLQPDIVLMDFNLPFQTGFDSVRLSRISGLDTAQTIVEETPNSRVVLLNNLEEIHYRKNGHASSTSTHLSTHRNGTKTSFTLKELRYGEMVAGAPVFANVEV